LDDQVLAFIKVIAPVLTKTGVSLDFLIHINLNKQQCGFMDFLLTIIRERQRGFLNQLVKIIREDLIRIHTKLANIPFLPDMDNRKSQLFVLIVDADTDIPLLMKMLATPHPSGQQRVIHLFLETYELVINVLDAIIEVET
jgi:hypothetical protein